MSLYDRIHNQDKENPVLPTLNTHILKASLTLVASGKFTATQAKNQMNLSPEEGVEFDQLLARVNAGATDGDKAFVLEDIDSVNVGTENGFIMNRTLYNSLLGIT